MHAAGFADPRSPDFHARSLRAERWAPMLDAAHPGACGRCHEASPARPAAVTGAARDAPSCASCHDQPGGPLACGTCHGEGQRASPPRDPCLHPGVAPSTGAHAAHLRASALHAAPFTCETCHPARTADLSGAHGDGVVDLAFAPDGGAFDPAARTCAVACHRRGGARPTPAWSDRGPMTCSDCHAAPPADHPLGPCTACHAEPDATATALRPGPLHLNGRVDLGDGSGACTACHGRAGGAEPWPATGSHAAHQAPRGGAPVACADCHAVPARVDDPVHFATGPRAAVRLGGRASARGATPGYDPTTGTCTNVACHGVGLLGARAEPPRWGDTSGAAARCGQCHGVPPPAPHPARADCAAAFCHGGEVAPTPDGPVITADGRARHQDGVVDHVGVAP
jgi:predicted CxxxxCH...CXXCH cytochrome family protein